MWLSERPCDRLSPASPSRRSGRLRLPFRPQVDDPVGGFDDVDVVLDDDDGVARGRRVGGGP